MNDWLLQIIRCPITAQPLQVASQEIVDKLREQSRSGQLTSHKGIVIDQPFDSGLVDQSHTYFYRIQDGIPSLLPDEAIHIPKTTTEKDASP